LQLPTHLKTYLIDKLTESVDQTSNFELTEELKEEIQEKCEVDLEELILEFGKDYLDTTDERIFRRHLRAVIEAWNSANRPDSELEEYISHEIDFIIELDEIELREPLHDNFIRMELTYLMYDLIEQKRKLYPLFDVTIYYWDACLEDGIKDFVITSAEWIDEEE
jgi:hypothetical protein